MEEDDVGLCDEKWQVIKPPGLYVNAPTAFCFMVQRAFELLSLPFDVRHITPAIKICIQSAEFSQVCAKGEIE